jgi:hypothetical protein
MLLVEWIEVAAAVLFAAASGRAGTAVGIGALRGLRRLARRPALAILTVGLAAGLLSAALSVRRLPIPRIADEFSYLLAADTFASGRLANSPHPLWTHFETYHVIQQPTYASKYPPGQGLALALGQMLSGRPAVGVWLSFAAAAAGMCWMLQAWVPPFWALLGSLACALNVELLRAWGDSYWGGALPMLGGALLFGALGRLRRSPTPAMVAVFACGAVVLAISRPYEGAVVVLPAAVALGFATARARRRGSRPATPRLFAPGLAVALAGVVWMGYYNYRVTGSSLRLPYVVHEQTYGPVPLFLFQSPKPKPWYRHPQMERGAMGWPMQVYAGERTLRLAIRAAADKAWQLAWFYAPPLLAWPLILMLPRIYRDPGVRYAALVGGLLFLAIALETFCFTHYAAPATCLVAVPIVRALRTLRLVRWGRRPVGLLYALAIPVVSAIAVLASPLASPRISPGSRFEDRQRLLQALEQSPGKHLVIVQYAPGQSPAEEWVYNRADIDGAKVVWARAMGVEEDRELQRYFADRHAWLVQPGSPPRAIVSPRAAEP